MSVLDRAALEQSPLADLHAIASELGIDGYRRLRKADLIDAPPFSIQRDWQSVTIAASARVSSRIDALHRRAS